jgi:hypothetical protein
MRRLTLGLAALVLASATGCGGGTQTLNTDYAAVLRATAAKTAAASSSRMSLATKTKVSGQNVSFSGDGAFSYTTKEGTFTFTIGGVPGAPTTKLVELITRGSLYVQVPGQPGFYKLALADLVGTSLAESSDPTYSLQTLAGVEGVTKVGTDTVRGAKTTHYKGTIDTDKALAELDGFVKDLAASAFSKSDLKKLPFDAWVDDQGRMRKLVQNVTITVQGQKADVESTIELYDFGTKVSVTPPPASEVHDGAAILDALKAAAG